MAEESSCCRRDWVRVATRLLHTWLCWSAGMDRWVPFEESCTSILGCWLSGIGESPLLWVLMKDGCSFSLLIPPLISMLLTSKVDGPAALCLLEGAFFLGVPDFLDLVLWLLLLTLRTFTLLRALSSADTLPALSLAAAFAALIKPGLISRLMRAE